MAATTILINRRPVCKTFRALLLILEQVELGETVVIFFHKKSFLNTIKESLLTNFKGPLVFFNHTEGCGSDFLLLIGAFATVRKLQEEVGIILFYVGDFNYTYSIPKVHIASFLNESFNEMLMKTAMGSLKGALIFFFVVTCDQAPYLSTILPRCYGKVRNTLCFRC